MTRALALIMLLLASPAVAGDYRPVDGDTWRWGEDRFRLAGVDAPECSPTPCGHEMLTALLHGVTRDDCVGHGWSYGREVVQCWTADGRDVGAVLVRLGLVRDHPEYLPDYGGE